MRASPSATFVGFAEVGVEIAANQDNIVLAHALFQEHCACLEMLFAPNSASFDGTADRSSGLVAVRGDIGADEVESVLVEGDVYTEPSV